jgi:hypothetical protein
MRRTAVPLWAAGLMIAVVLTSLPLDAREQDPASRPYVETLSPGEANPPADVQPPKESQDSTKAVDSEQGKRKHDLRSLLLLWVLRKHPPQ